MNKFLSISIPTYNRSQKLIQNLSILIKCIEQYEIPIYVFDNSDNFETNDLLINFTYPFIYYSKNKTNIGAEKNFIQALRSPATKYVWLFGDDDTFNTIEFEKLLKFILLNEVDLIILNQKSFRKKVFNDLYINDINLLFQNYIAHMTYISSLIFSKDLIHQLDFNKYLGFTFSHIFPIFELKSIKVFLFSKIIVQPLPSRINSFASNIAKYFVIDFYKSLELLGRKFTTKQKIIAHRKIYNIYFNKYYYLLKSRIKYNEFNFQVYFKNYKAFRSAFNSVDNFLIFISCFIPSLK
jgi:hypothetical protein